MGLYLLCIIIIPISVITILNLIVIPGNNSVISEIIYLLFHSAAKDQENDFGTYHDIIIRSKNKGKSIDKQS